MDAVNDEDAKRIIADNVQRLLEKRGWSGRQLAEATGDTPMRINDLIRARHTPGIGVVTRVAAALDTSVDYLLQPEHQTVEASVA
jgi:transcriptional regulator with XRE-family HTH domain